MQENCLCASAARFQLSQRILQRAAEISEEMDLALQALGYTQGSIKQRLQALADASGSAYEASEGVREEILAEYTRLVGDLQERTGVAFRDLPGQDVVVRAEPRDTEAGAAGAHYNPPRWMVARPEYFLSICAIPRKPSALPLAILRREVERALPVAGG